ncbi:MAG: putative quinol monooxygenase [Marinosulfonomonas sp.]
MSENIVITGTLTCTPQDLEMVQVEVAEHVRLTRAEPGCISFSIDPSETDPCIFIVRERFVDQAAFDAHTARTRASQWWKKSKHIPRNLKTVPK